MRLIASLTYVRTLLWLLILIIGLTSGRSALAGPPEEVLHTFNSYGDGTYTNATLTQAKDGNFYGVTLYGGTNGHGTVFQLTPAGKLTTLHSFTDSYTDGSVPSDVPLQGSDGFLYGTTTYGGLNNEGVVYKLSADGTTFNILHSFNSNFNGAYPDAPLIQGSDGFLYGTAYEGGINGYGTVFRISTDETTFSVLHSFDYSDGSALYGGVIQGSDGYLYGVTEYGGTDGYGVVFKLSTDGATFNLIHSFNGSDGVYPAASLVQGSDGFLYGTAYEGSTYGDGTVFRISTDGSLFNTLHSFAGSDGADPATALIQGSDGKLYGTTSYGSANGYGVVYQISTDGTTFNVLHNFDYSPDGAYPYGGVIQGSDGFLYGTTYEGGTGYVGIIFQLSTNGSTFNTLFDFANGFHDGLYPDGSLTSGPDGNLYGTTTSGGIYGDGALYRFDPNTDSVTILHNFDNSDGADPVSHVIFGSDGNLYGTTWLGGAYGKGTLFRYNPTSQTLTSLFSFDGSNGTSPFAGMIQAGSALYGTTIDGGQYNAGTIFKLTLPTRAQPHGVFSILYSFTGGSDGANSQSALLLASNGCFYGVTAYGGTNGYGTVFKITPSGVLTTRHSFSLGDGAYPDAALIQGSDGYLYGTTYEGGPNGYGTVFQISLTGNSFHNLHSFSYLDGAYPYTNMIQGSDGNLYGTTYEGGINGYGAVFQISTDGSTFNTIYSFEGSPIDGAGPATGVIEGADGNLYGTTQNGGIPPSGDPDVNVGGTLYRLQTNLPLFAPNQPRISSFSPARVYTGTTVTVKGVNLQSASSVSIDGVAQTISSDSAKSLKFTVTSGTTTGLIVVTTPNGTATSATALVIETHVVLQQVGAQATRNADGSVTVSVQVANNGTDPAQNTQLSSAMLGSVSGAPVPQSLGTVNAGDVIDVITTYPNPGAKGSKLTLTLSGSFTGGTWKSSFSLILP